MKYNEGPEYRIFDSLIDKNIRFALYHLPNEQDICFVLQLSADVLSYEQLSELNGKVGFAISPFHTSDSSPIILIRPEVVLHQEKSIFEYLSNSTLNNSNGKTKPFATEATSFDEYSRTYNIFLNKLNADEYQKLVLSRTFDMPRTESFSVGTSFQKACKKYPNNFVFLCHTPETGTWMGCSPELLLSGENNKWKTVALAGTKNISKNKPEWDEKNRIEQQIVTDYMSQQLEKAGYAHSQGEPFTAQAGNLAHLKTEFSFEMENSDKTGNLLELLHPSPAVCGFPKDKAYNFILQNEGYDRRYYSGFVGNLGIGGKTDLYVNLRSMEVNKDMLRLYAGGGLLPSSDLISEWNETENKLQTILSII